MRAAFTALCQYCGQAFSSRNVRRIYCSARCRRDAQNDRRLAERAELREFTERLAWDEQPHWMQDPWALMEEEDGAWDGIWGNCLLDAMPLVDNPWGGPSVATERKPKGKKRKRHEGQACLPGMEAWLS